jgi:hypothetical protein
MQRRKQQAGEYDHQAAEAGGKLMANELQFAVDALQVGSQRRLDVLQIGPQRSLDALQVGVDRGDICLGRYIVVYRVEDFGGDPFGLLALDIGIRQGVGEG